MFACIYIPDFAVEALIRFEPELRVRCVAVLAGRPPLEKVVALNEKARQTGVETGATRAQLEAWEELVLRTRSQAQEDSAHAALLDCAHSFSPEIEDTAPNTVLLNLAGLEPLFGPVSKIARDLAHRMSKMELEANVAVASNPDAALLAARGFSGVTLIAEGQEAERLGDLPVDVLLESFASDAAEATRWLETFDRWGIRKLRALASLPEVPLSERLGQQGIRLQKLARGRAARNLQSFEPPLVFAECVELEYPIVLLEPLAFLLNRMLEQVCARLGARALAAQELRLQLELEPCAQGRMPDVSAAEQPNSPVRVTRRLRLPVPMLDVKMFLKLLQLDLQANPPGAPIVKIHVSAEPAHPRATQSGLFLPPFPEPEKLELTLARIAGIVGEGRVGSVELLDTHRQGAFEVKHFAPVGPETKKSEKRRKDENVSQNDSASQVERNAQERMSAVIALRLFRPPLRAVISMREGKPVRLRCPQRVDITGEIVWTAGPWRSSGDWSEQEGWSREEWDIAMPAESGFVLYRLVQDKLNAKWFVEGTYD
jgi:protein ImuB